MLPEVTSTTVTSRVQSGIDIINNTDSQKFHQVLIKVAQWIQNKTNDCRPFSEDNEDRLSSALAISTTDLNLMLDCATLILKQAAFNKTNPAILHQQLLQQYKLSEDKAQIFVTVWTNHAKQIVAALKMKSTYPKQVEGVSWLLNMSVSSSDSGTMMKPHAVIELKLQDSENLRLDLNQLQLQNLYETLEDIQTQLDNLK